MTENAVLASEGEQPPAPGMNTTADFSSPQKADNEETKSDIDIK